MQWAMLMGMFVIWYVGGKKKKKMVFQDNTENHWWQKSRIFAENDVLQLFTEMLHIDHHQLF